MLPIYLPIAEMSVSAILLLLMGGGIGFLAGLFGISGGFLLTPLLILIGIPAPVAVGTQANQAVASATSGMLAHSQKRNVDRVLAGVMLGGSAIGTVLGSLIFGWLKAMGQVDFFISILYVFFLGLIGSMMLYESARYMLGRPQGISVPLVKREVPKLLQKLPFKYIFKDSGLRISVLVPFIVGVITGITTVIMGLGGSLLVPAMIYLMALPAGMVAGTSLYQVIFTSIAATVMHAYYHHTVDLMLALPLMIGSVIGAQLGSRITGRMRPDLSRLILSLIILFVAVKLLFGLMWTPSNLFSWEVLGS